MGLSFSGPDFPAARAVLPASRKSAFQRPMDPAMNPLPAQWIHAGKADLDLRFSEGDYSVATRDILVAWTATLVSS